MQTQGDAPRTSLAKRLGLILLSLLLSLALAEAAVRLLLERPQSARVESTAGLRKRLQRENAHPKDLRMAVAPGDQLIVDTPTGFRLRANTRAVIENHRLSKRDIVVETNAYGFRGPELGDRRDGVPRVLFIGDSITLGDYVAEEETFVRQVEQRFRAEGREVETINAGVGAIGLQNELAILMETGLAVEPDVVVVGFYLNDAMSSRGVDVLRVPRGLGWSRLAGHLAHALPFLLERDGSKTGLGVRRLWAEEVAAAFPPAEGDPLTEPGAFHALLQDAWKDWGSAWSDSAWERLEPVIEEFERQSERAGFELLFLCFPVRSQVHAEFVIDHPQRRLAGVLERLDVPLLDLLPPLRELWREQGRVERSLFYDQCHHTPLANARIADWVHDFLRSQI